MPLLTSLLTDSSQQSFQPSNPRSEVGLLQQPPTQSPSVWLGDIRARVSRWFNFLKLLKITATFVHTLGPDRTAGINHNIELLWPCPSLNFVISGGIMGQKMVKQILETSVKASSELRMRKVRRLGCSFNVWWDVRIALIWCKLSYLWVMMMLPN